MRVLVVTPWFPSALKPGAGAFVARDAELLRSDHEVTVLHLAEAGDVGAAEPAREELGPGAWLVRQRFDPLNPVSQLRAVRVIRGLLREADAVHSMALHAVPPVRLARPAVPWVHTEHWSAFIQSSPPLKKRLGLALYRSSLKRPDAVVAVGEALARSAGRYTRHEVRVIPNHVRLGGAGDLPEAPESRGAAPLRLVSVGNMVSSKGPLAAVDAVHELRRRGVPATLTWIGAGPLREEMLRRADRMGVGDRVALAGQVAPERVAEILRRSHVFMLPTRFETFGIAIAEALGQGLPVVATGHGGHREFTPPGAVRIANDRTGGGLADAVVSLVSDEDRWAAPQIMAYARERFSDDRRRVAYAAVYDELS